MLIQLRQSPLVVDAMRCALSQCSLLDESSCVRVAKPMVPHDLFVLGYRQAQAFKNKNKTQGSPWGASEGGQMPPLASEHMACTPGPRPFLVGRPVPEPRRLFFRWNTAQSHSWTDLGGRGTGNYVPE